jgi:hypothetical protein
VSMSQPANRVGHLPCPAPHALSGQRVPLVVQYLYVHERGEAFYYPTIRADSSAVGVAVRYLECALTQVASLRLQDAGCEIALATNVRDRSVLGRVGSELLNRIEALGVQILPTEYRHRPSEGTEQYVSSRYLFDAILSATAGQPADRQLWLTDLDCVWAEPELVFASVPSQDEVGCIYIDYHADWDTVGFGADGLTRRAIGELAAGMGGSEEVPPWVGGELLCGTPTALQELVRICDALDAKLAEEGKALPNEEQILSLAGATGRVQFRDLSRVARRMSTGPRNRAAPVEDPSSIGLWHLPSEKGLSLRRTASDIRRGRMTRVRRDFYEPARTARRFNVAGTGLGRRIQDDGWLVAQRISSVMRSRFSRSQRA